MALPATSKLLAHLDQYRRSDWWVGYKLIVPITKEDLKSGKNTVEFLPKDVLNPTRIEEKGQIVPFGKYKGKTIDWLRENDENYLEWLRENVKGFKNV